MMNTKHYYNGTERIASRLGDNNTTIAIDNMLENRKVSLEEQFRNDIQELISEPTQVDMPPMLDILNLQPTGTPNDVFYYHVNHLGSTSFVTDQNQTITQGFLYAPFGEITTEYNVNFGNNTIPKYSFNAKELDEETGMYYYEARYYKPPVFTSRDPMFEKYFWMSPYAYCANNPIKYVDPSGKEMELNDDIVLRGQNNSSVTIKTDLVDINVNVSSLGVDFGGNYTLQGDEMLSAALDLAGIVDPTGIADGANAVLQAKKGDWLNAGISAVAIIPVVGDVAKVGKIKKDVNIIKNAIKLNKAKSLNQLNKAVQTGQAPKGIIRFDKGQGTKNLPYDEVHFDDGSSLYKNGTWRHDKGYKITKEQQKFLEENGWTIPK